MTTETILLIASLVFAGAGWLAFAKEYRARRRDNLQFRRALAVEEQAFHHWHARWKEAQAQLTRLTDRDERGRFVKREGV